MIKRINSLWRIGFIFLCVCLCFGFLKPLPLSAGSMYHEVTGTGLWESDEPTRDDLINSMAGETALLENTQEGGTGLVGDGVIQAHVQGEDTDTTNRIASYLQGVKNGNSSVFTRSMLEYLLHNAKACWFCDVFKTIYKAINTLATNIFNKMAKAFLNLMGVGILFLILFKVGRMLVQLQDVDLMQFLNDLFRPLGRAIIATAMLTVLVASNSQTVFYIVTNPILDVSLKLGGSILETTLGKVEYLYTTGTDVDSVITKSLNPDWSTVNSQYETENKTPASTALGEATQNMLVEWLQSVASSFMVGIAIGVTFMKVGFSKFFTGGFSMLLSGLFIWGGFWILYLAFPFKIIDAFIRLAFVLTLMPLWIVLWVFPVTQQYSKRAFEMFLSSCFLFITISIMISLILMLINHVVPDPLYGEGGASIRRSEFFNELIADHNENALKYVNIGCGMIMNAIAFTAMGGALLSAAGTIANSFIGGDGASVKANIGDRDRKSVV